MVAVELGMGDTEIVSTGIQMKIREILCPILSREIKPAQSFMMKKEIQMDSCGLALRIRAKTTKIF